MNDGSSLKIKKPDLSGKDRLLSNVLWGWGSYLVVIIAGFIMPRLIDRHVGQVNLGIWDFSWSLVSYLSYSGMGIGSSINRYVAKYRSLRDTTKLRGAVSSVFLVQNGISLFILAGGVGIALGLPYYFSEKLGSALEQAQWVVILLGASLAVDQAAGTFRGIITGCHRWDIYNILNALARVGGFLLMLGVLLIGMGLKALAAAHLATTIFFALLRALIAFRVCPGLRISLKYANLQQAKKMVAFGWKSFVINMAPLLLIQTSNIFITGIFGPSALAIFSRSVALVRHMETIVNRFSFITTPIASVLKTEKGSEALKQFFYESCRMGVAIALPIVLTFIFLGNNILHIWMGENYIAGWTLPLLAAGYFLPVALNPAVNILIGMNRHGKIGLIVSSIMATAFVILLIILGEIGWSLPRATMLISLPLILGNGLIIPLFTGRILGVSFVDFLKEIFLFPIICNIPLAIIFYLNQHRLSVHPVPIVFGSIMLVALTITALLYFHFVLPVYYREKITKALDGKLNFFHI